MIFVLSRDAIALDVLASYRVKLAHALEIPESMVSIQLERHGDQARPRVDIELPPAMPPATVDVNDPVQMREWEESVRDMPGVMDFLKAKGIDQPQRVIDLYVQVMMQEMSKRIAAAIPPKYVHGLVK